MPVTFSSNNYSVTAKAQDVITSAFLELNRYAPGEAIAAEDAAWGLEKLQRIIDQTNAKRACIYNVSFSRYSLVLNKQPITIGPSGDFSVNIRPVKIVNWSLILLGNTPEVEVPGNLRDDDWWARNTIKALTSTLPTDLYYSPDIPLGNLYFWPIPTQANDVRLETWVGLAQAVALTTSIGLPAAYWQWLVLELAMNLAPSYGAGAIAVVSSGPFAQAYRQAIKAMEGNNAMPPRMNTAPSGMPGRSDGRPDFNFLTGLPR